MILKYSAFGAWFCWLLIDAALGARPSSRYLWIFIIKQLLVLPQIELSIFMFLRPRRAPRDQRWKRNIFKHLADAARETFHFCYL